MARVVEWSRSVQCKHTLTPSKEKKKKKNKKWRSKQIKKRHRIRKFYLDSSKHINRGFNYFSRCQPIIDSKLVIHPLKVEKICFSLISFYFVWMKIWGVLIIFFVLIINFFCFVLCFTCGLCEESLD